MEVTSSKSALLMPTAASAAGSRSQPIISVSLKYTAVRSRFSSITGSASCSTVRVVWSSSGWVAVITGGPALRAALHAAC